MLHSFVSTRFYRHFVHTINCIKSINNLSKTWIRFTCNRIGSLPTRTMINRIIDTDQVIKEKTKWIWESRQLINICKTKLSDLSLRWHVEIRSSWASSISKCVLFVGKVRVILLETNTAQICICKWFFQINSWINMVGYRPSLYNMTSVK